MTLTAVYARLSLNLVCKNHQFTFPNLMSLLLSVHDGLTEKVIAGTNKVLQLNPLTFLRVFAMHIRSNTTK